MPVPGDVIAGKYAVEAVVGRGGMSVVYRATHLELDQRVAIKVLAAAALLLPEYVVRLKREARAVSHIRSEHVVRVHDIGELPGAGVPYLVMEYVSGLDLAALLARRGPLPIDIATECIMQACEALAEAHALGIVHRDLKPANLFLTQAVDGSPCVKVLDFGISRMAPRHGLTSLTDPGTVLGTPSYMAPERMEASDKVDARADIWSLGAILFELLVGKPPYTGESLPQLFLKIMRSRPPRASSLRRGLPPEIDTIIGRCLAVDPANRWQSVADLGWALAALDPARGREAAARITRVLERAASDLAATSFTGLPAVTVGDGAPRPRAVKKHVAAAVASTCVLGAAGIFGVTSSRHPSDAIAPSHEIVPVAPTVEPVRLAPEPTALAIPRATRPAMADDVAAVAPALAATASLPPPKPRPRIAVAPDAPIVSQPSDPSPEAIEPPLQEPNPPEEPD
ncbi:MAG: protein kinase [Labilithrix sp.]|nr:protein kinase [Labilithrix sp.]